MAKVLESTANAATKEEYEDLKNKLSEGKVETEKLENKLAVLEKQMFQEKKGQLEAEKEHADLKQKFTVLETIMKEQKEVKCFNHRLFPLNIPVHI
jgi:predicted  nucleic acid-binding Zn-ribbon protein